MSKTGAYFQTYLRRALDNLKTADEERSGVAPDSPFRASPSTFSSLSNPSRRRSTNLHQRHSLSPQSKRRDQSSLLAAIARVGAERRGKRSDAGSQVGGTSVDVWVQRGGGGDGEDGVSGRSCRGFLCRKSSHVYRVSLLLVPAR